jgi:general secretion pathway protein N
MQLGGTLRLSSPGAGLEAAAGRLRFTGQASLELIDVSSSLSTLDRLGSYRVQVDDAPDGAGPAIALSTLDGALLLDGKGQWTGTQLRFRGEARAAPGFEGALDNLLNIFGRRQGALSLISIG